MNAEKCRDTLEEWKMALGMVFNRGGFFSDRLCDSRSPQLGCITSDNCIDYLTAMTDWDDEYIGGLANPVSSLRSLMPAVSIKFLHCRFHGGIRDGSRALWRSALR